MNRSQRRPLHLVVTSIALTLAACGSSEDVNKLPDFVKGDVLHQTYDGTSNDLLTGGLGKTGLAAAATALPAFADPAHPTAAELRTRAIYNNYRALVDFTAAGGFGVLYGPNIDANGNDTLGEGKIAGDEYLAYEDDGTGQVNVTMMVQVPATFDPANACIVTGTSSGSRGVYGAIATSGEWGLKHGCAVAYTDKGTGMGVHDLSANTVNLITGERADATAAGKSANFVALTGSALSAFNAIDPNRFAFKHAHSKQNPEKDWGKFTLDAVQFAFYVVNQQYGKPASNGKDKLRTLNAGNTIVIASSVSNGGGAALQAAEQDTSNLIDGVVAGEPQIQVAADPRRSILRGGAPVTANGKPLYDYATIANLYQPCAAQAAAAAASPGLSFVDATRAKNRCATLRALNYLSKDTLAEQADEALAKLREAGFEKETDLLHASQWAFATPAIAVTYAYSYGRFGVDQRTCGYTFAATDATTGAPVAVSATALAQIFASGNGIPPTGGINVVADQAKNGPILDALAQSTSSGVADYNADGADCLRKLYTGTDANAQAVKSGVGEVLRTANLHGKPAILVQGRSDQNVPVNHASRAWMAQNRLAEGAASKARYLEVTNAQHFDTFIPAVPGYATAFIPLHRYFIQAMDLMYASLKSGAALPDSQVVRTTPRSSATAQITTTNVPAVPLTAAAADKITFQGDALAIPE